MYKLYVKPEEVEQWKAELQKLGLDVDVAPREKGNLPMLQNETHRFTGLDLVEWKLRSMSTAK